MPLAFDESGNPLISFGVVVDITNYKSDNDITLVLSHYKPKTGFVEDAILHFPEEKPNKASKRELEIQNLISNGLTSQQIADELHLSIHTVNTHRKNMGKKLDKGS